MPGVVVRSEDFECRLPLVLFVLSLSVRSCLHSQCKNCSYMNPEIHVGFIAKVWIHDLRAKKKINVP